MTRRGSTRWRPWAGRAAFALTAACLAGSLCIAGPAMAQPTKAKAGDKVQADARPAAGSGPGADAATPLPPAPNTAGATAPAVQPSSAARRLYDQNRDKLVQVRVLVAGSASQASAGSGFAVAADGLLVTNYHVVSQLVQEPDRYRAEYLRTDRVEGALTVLAIDVQHDLALVRAVARAGGPTAWSTVTLAPDDSLEQGDRVFSMGNPLDLGFAISEGTYNGLPERSLYPHLLFTGAMNPGVSGGPALDEAGRVVGVNVAGYGRSAELTNFQVPVRYVRALLERARPRLATGQAPSAQDLRADVRQQLMAHQALMLDGLGATGWKTQPLGPYRVPVIPEHLARCWGDVSKAETRNYRLESSRCNLASARYISASMQVGSVATQHEVLTAERLGVLRLASMRSQSLRNEAAALGQQTRERTAPRCTERFVRTASLPLRVIVCARAYRKLEGLFDITTWAVTLDSEREGLESVLRLNGVDHERGLQESRRFVDALARRTAP